MKENFMTCHQDGLGIAEIAAKFEVTTTTIYKSLQEIADANGVERKELLERVHRPHIITATRKPEHADFDEVLVLTGTLTRRIGILLERINKMEGM
jgi:predicted transcriptional regulator